MSSHTIFSLAPYLIDEAGHGLAYQTCLEQAAKKLDCPFFALLPKQCTLKSLPKNWIPTFSINRLFRLFSFCNQFRKEEKKILFLESFNTTDLFALTVAALLFSKKSDQLCLLFRYGLLPLTHQKKVHLFLIKLLQLRMQKRLKLFSDSELIAKEYEKHLPAKVTVLPIPHTERHTPSNHSRIKTVCWWPGSPREAKGLKELNFLANLPGRNPQQIELLAARQSLLPHTTLIADVLTREEYLNYLEKSDFILLPYDPTVYRAGTSGIFVEAIVAGKVPLVKRGSWLAYELEKHGLSELIVEWDNPNFFSEISALTKFSTVQEKLEKMKQTYIKFHSIDTFTHLLEQTIKTESICVG